MRCSPKLAPIKAQPEEEATILSVAPEAEENFPELAPEAEDAFAAAQLEPEFEPEA